MRFFGKTKEEKMAEMQAKQALKNGKSLKQVLTTLKENRDQIEHSTGKRPEIDDTTKLFMQKVLNVWISEGRDIDDENSGMQLISINSLIIRLNTMRDNFLQN